LDELLELRRPVEEAVLRVHVQMHELRVIHAWRRLTGGLGYSQLRSPIRCRERSPSPGAPVAYGSGVALRLRRLFPLDRAGRFGGDVVGDAVHALDFVADSA